MQFPNIGGDELLEFDEIVESNFSTGYKLLSSSIENNIMKMELQLTEKNIYVKNNQLLEKVKNIVWD